MTAFVPIYPRFCQSPGQNDTSCVARALAAAIGKVLYWNYPPGGKYVIAPTPLSSNSTHWVDPGVTIQAGTGYGPNDRLIRIESVNNVTFFCNGAIFSVPGYLAGTQNHVFNISASTNVSLYNCNARSTGGDGFTISGLSRKILIEGGSGNNNRRNGVSITNAQDVIVRNASFCNNGGTAPGDGVDIEPDDITDTLQGIRLENVHTCNNLLDGIVMNQSLYTSASPAIDVEIDGSSDDGSIIGLDYTGTASARGSIRVNGFTSRNAIQNGIRIEEESSRNISAVFTDPTVVDADTSGLKSKYGAGIAIFREPTEPGSGPLTGVTVTGATVIDDRVTPLIVYPLYLSDDKNIGVANVQVTNWKLISGIGGLGWNTSPAWTDDPFNVLKESLTASAALSFRAIPRTVNNTGASGFVNITLPADSLEPPITFVNTAGQPLAASPATGEQILPYPVNTPAYLYHKGDTFTLQRVSPTTWQVVSGRVDLVNYTFANLPAAPSQPGASPVYCTDCDADSAWNTADRQYTCTAGGKGTGSVAYSNGTKWTCSGHGP